MGFGEAVKTVYSKYATFSGRASRPEYWWFYLFYLIVYLALYIPAFSMMMGAVADATVDPNTGELVTSSASTPALATVLMLIAAAFVLGSLLPMLGVLVRRLHDTGRSGWWFWIGLIPFIGGLVLLVFMILPSDEGPNAYGPQE